ncbi:MAG: site-2 protease family protein [Clostridia bacterium]|nr:site-2 protease family protein [Clostridia bacterium]
MSEFFSTVAVGWGKVWPILFAIFFFGVIIMSHELGHFTFAKLFKVKVNKFAIGMGPKLFKKKKGDTEYSLRLFPIGGFVAMEGEDDDSEDEGAFSKKKVWQRIIIVAAGAIVNLILGLLIVIFMLTQENLIGTPRVNQFYEEATTVNYGLQEGDIIKEINGRKVFSSYDLSFLLSRDKDGTVDFVVDRNGEEKALSGVRFQTAELEDGTTTMVFDFSVVGIEPSFTSVIKYGFLESISIGRIVWISFFDLITGTYGFSDLSGPIGTVGYIAEITQEAVKTDITPMLMILALISINIGIFNLLPVPALDGGRLFFLFIELIFRKPINRKYEGWIHAVGLVLLMLLMVAISFSDITKLVRGELF